MSSVGTIHNMKKFDMMPYAYKIQDFCWQYFKYTARTSNNVNYYVFVIMKTCYDTLRDFSAKSVN
ncbi:MAG: hypothetical protein HC830_08860 [Bacteroidetes bacterium]|nr:hypothetical protein [Bacteroidota bacterium]